MFVKLYGQYRVMVTAQISERCQGNRDIELPCYSDTWVTSVSMLAFVLSDRVRVRCLHWFTGPIRFG